MKKTNWKTIATAVTEHEKKIIQQKAFQSNMTLSEYMKTRLLGDSDSLEVKLTQHEKDIMTVNIKCFYMLSKLVLRKKDINLENILKEADDFLVEKKYKTQEEFDKLYNTNSNNN
jgi:hypothetical protein